VNLPERRQAALLNLIAGPHDTVWLAAGAVSICLLILLVWILRRTADSARVAGELRTLAAAVQIQQATMDVLERRLGQLQGSIADDAGRLRESVLQRIDDGKEAMLVQAGEDRTRFVQLLGEHREQVKTSMGEFQNAGERRHAETAQTIHAGMQTGFTALHRQLNDALQRNAADLGSRVDSLTQTTDRRLQDIGGQVDRRLAEGFEKTTSTFASVLQRLAVIDEAQKKITALSGDVISLQQILADKRSRGAFGEVQLAALVRNILPESNFSLQHTLPNDRIVDCLLYLPEPTGTIAIDAKFPLESFRVLSDFNIGDHERRQAERQFKQDIRKHIRDIAARYILPGVTADGAVMFIPAEAVFAEVQAHHPELVDEAHAARVWIVSPTTLWAILNTACSVLKDAATREQVDIIQEHLVLLAKDFKRFRERMDQLARHIEQANEDVRRVHTSAAKISDRFDKIERVELDSEPASPTVLPTNETEN
jgi:DNA recombination protein RmuC